MGDLRHNGTMGMENTYRMRAAHDELKKSKERVHPVTGDEMELGEHDRTLGQIMQNKQEQDKFLGQFCFQTDPAMSEQVAVELAAGRLLMPDQTAFLEKMRGEYNLRRAEIEKIQEALTPEEIQHIGRLNPDIQQIIGQIGPDKTAELLGREFEGLGLSDTKAFKKLVTQMSLVNSQRTNPHTEDIEREVQEKLGRYGISEEQYWEATQGGTKWQTKQRLELLAENNLRGFKAAVDFLTFNSISRKRGANLYKNFEEQTAVLKECDKHLKAIGAVLQGTLNGDVRLAIQKAMLEGGEIKEKKVEKNVTTIQEYQRVKEESDPSPAAIKSRYEKYEKAELERRKLSIADRSKFRPQLDEIKDSFADAELKRMKEYKPSALFAALFAFLFSSAPKNRDDIKRFL